MVLYVYKLLWLVTSWLCSDNAVLSSLSSLSPKKAFRPFPSRS